MSWKQLTMFVFFISGRYAKLHMFYYSSQSIFGIKSPSVGIIPITKEHCIDRVENCQRTSSSMGRRVFKWGIQNWKDFCLEINIPKGILRITLMGRCHKVTNFDFQSQFCTSKSWECFSIFFFIEEYLGA